MLLYIDALLDVVEVQQRSGKSVGISRDLRARALVNAGVVRLAALSGNERELACRRLWYRLAALGLRMSPWLFDRTRNFFGLGDLLEAMGRAGYPVASFGNDAYSPLLVSASLGNGEFRVPFTVAGENSFGERRGWLDAALSGLSVQLSTDVTVPDFIELGHGNNVIAAVRAIPVRHGSSPSSISKGPLAQEFIHIGLTPMGGELDGITPDKLTAIVVGHQSEGLSLLPAFASVSMALPIKAGLSPDDNVWPSSTRCTIRLNMAGMLDSIDKLDVFLVKGAWQ